MASEGWTTEPRIQTPDFMPYLGGTLGIAIRRGEIPGLKDFLLKINPDNDPDNRVDTTIVSLLIHFLNPLIMGTSFVSIPFRTGNPLGYDLIKT